MNRNKNTAERQSADKAKDSRRMIHPELSCFFISARRRGKAFPLLDFPQSRFRRQFKEGL